MFIRVNACAVAVVALFAAGSVQAADLIIDGPAVQAATAGVDWSGAYIGGHAGVGTGTVSWETISFESDYDTDGMIAGVQAGYNWQHGNLVYGLEADLSLTDISGDDLSGFTGRDHNWLATARGRVGYAFDSVLLYATAGVAVANSTAFSIFGLIEDTNTHVGVAAGLGLEAMVAENVSVKAEYMYYGLGNETYFPDMFNSTVGFDIHTAKVGFNFHF